MKNRWVAVGISGVATLIYLVWSLINLGYFIEYVDFYGAGALEILGQILRWLVLLVLVAGLFVINILTAVKKKQFVGTIVNFILFLAIHLCWWDIMIGSGNPSFFNAYIVYAFEEVFFIVLLVGFILVGIDFLIYCLSEKESEDKNVTAITPQQASEKIKELKSLMEKGIITESEYKEKSEKYVEYL